MCFLARGADTAESTVSICALLVKAFGFSTGIRIL